MVEFGQLAEIADLREFWKSEPLDFTPWVVANIGQLNEALGLDLEVRSSEQPIGPFRADIVCAVTSAEDHLVLIENQLERTDHGHLGQLLTYAAGIDAVTIVWIAKSFAEDHRAALDWLNNHTDDHLRFFGVQVRVWKIGNSLPAVQFEVVSRPNNWTNQARIAIEGAATDGQRAQVAYWNAFREWGTSTGQKHVPATSPKANWATFGIGRSGFHLSMVAARADAKGLHPVSHLRVELVIDGSQAAHYYAKLQERQPEIEAALGEVVWYQVDAVNMRRIYVWKEADVSDESDWAQQFDWLSEQTLAFDHLFRALIPQLPTPETPPPPTS